LPLLRNSIDWIITPVGMRTGARFLGRCSARKASVSAALVTRVPCHRFCRSVPAIADQATVNASSNAIDQVADVFTSAQRSPRSGRNTRTDSAMTATTAKTIMAANSDESKPAAIAPWTWR
jgi:hypothetical protein